MAVTQKQIAQALGVSHQLVSFALNGGGTVSETRRREILATAQEMGYRRNEVARAMVTGHNRVIGVLTYDHASENIAQIIMGASAEATHHGYSIKVLHLPFYGTRSENCEAIRRSSEWRLAGLLAVTLREQTLESLRDELEVHHSPVAYIEASLQTKGILVSTDDDQAVRTIVQHLFDLGHRRFAFVSGEENSPVSKQRIKSFLAALGDLGLPIHAKSTLASNWGDPSIIEPAVREVLSVTPRPTALVGAGDGIAMVAIRTARQLGLSVPRDLSVIGFGNFSMAQYCDPPLTSMAQPFGDIGSVAVRRLLEQVKDEKDEADNPASFLAKTSLDLLPAHLIVRESTAPAP